MKFLIILRNISKHVNKNKKNVTTLASDSRDAFHDSNISFPTFVASLNLSSSQPNSEM